MTLDEAKEAVRHIDPKWDESEASFRCAVTLILSAVHGPFITKLRKITRYRSNESHQWAYNWRRSQVWNGGKVAGADWLEKDGGIAFLCDVNVGLGLLERAGLMRRARASKKFGARAVVE